MLQVLRVLPAFAENPSPGPSTMLDDPPPPVTPAPGNITPPPSGLYGHLYLHAHTHPTF